MPGLVLEVYSLELCLLLWVSGFGSELSVLVHGFSGSCLGTESSRFGERVYGLGVEGSGNP